MQVLPRSWHILSLSIYTAITALVAVALAWPVPFTLFLLCGVPLLVLIFETNLPIARLLATVSVLFVVVLILDAVAHTTGAWYTVVGSPWRFFGITFESALFAFVHTMYLLVLYEFLFDDTRVKSLSRRRLSGLVASFVTLIIATFYLFSVWLVNFAFAWIIGLLLIFIVGVLWLGYRGDSVRLITKSLFFGVMVLPLSLIFEMVALAGQVRIFAFNSEYLGTLTLVGQTFPIEELLLLVVWPTLLVFLYECFIDDGQ